MLIVAQVCLLKHEPIFFGTEFIGIQDTIYHQAPCSLQFSLKIRSPGAHFVTSQSLLATLVIPNFFNDFECHLDHLCWQSNRFQLFRKLPIEISFLDGRLRAIGDLLVLAAAVIIKVRFAVPICRCFDSDDSLATATPKQAPVSKGEAGVDDGWTVKPSS